MTDTAETTTFEEVIFVPGNWHCRECGTRISEADEELRGKRTSDKCPDCESQLEPVTWKMAALEAWAMVNEVTAELIEIRDIADQLKPSDAPMFDDAGVSFKWADVVAVVRSESPTGSGIYLRGCSDVIIIRMEHSCSVNLWRENT